MKQECWQNFLQRDTQSSSLIIDKNYCWTALKYTKPLQFEITLALKDSDKNMTVCMKAKEDLVKRLSFPKLQPNLLEPLIIPCKKAHIKITKETVAQTLMIQAATKALRLDKINF